MTATYIMRGNRPTRRDPATHRFAVGQTVPGAGMSPYRITATLPPRENSPQYRIRNEEERHERVTTEDSIELIGASLARNGADLIERTFGNG